MDKPTVRLVKGHWWCGSNVWECELMLMNGETIRAIGTSPRKAYEQWSYFVLIRDMVRRSEGPITRIEFA